MTVATHEPAQGLRKINAYHEFQRREGIPVLTGFAVDDVATVELGPWARTGGLGAFVNLEGTGGANAAYIAEIPAGGSLTPQRHMYEEMVYVVSGTGSTSVWYEEDQKVSFEWKAGSLFSIPLNAWHRHYNAQGALPARYLSVTTAPLVMNLFHNEEFIFDNPFQFKDRFSEQGDFFSSEGKLHAESEFGRHVWETNFVADVHAVPLYSRPVRGAGGRIAFFEMADNSLCAHISEFPVATYKKGHRHGPGAHVIILDGQGYSRLWPEGAEPKEVSWHRGSMVVPPDHWFHQHYNTGAQPARYLALRWGSRKYDVGSFLNNDETESGGARSSTDVRLGGNQIEYDGEDPAIHKSFEERLASAGVPCGMRALHPLCTGPA